MNKISYTFLEQKYESLKTISIRQSEQLALALKEKNDLLKEVGKLTADLSTARTAGVRLAAQVLGQSKPTRPEPKFEDKQIVVSLRSDGTPWKFSKILEPPTWRDDYGGWAYYSTTSEGCWTAERWYRALTSDEKRMLDGLNV